MTDDATCAGVADNWQYFLASPTYRVRKGVGRASSSTHPLL